VVLVFIAVRLELENVHLSHKPLFVPKMIDAGIRKPSEI
jgi:hypothetical protein